MQVFTKSFSFTGNQLDRIDKTINRYLIDNEVLIQSLASCKGPDGGVVVITTLEKIDLDDESGKERVEGRNDDEVCK